MTEYVGSTYTGKLDHNGKWTGEGELVYAATGVKYVGSFFDGQVSCGKKNKKELNKEKGNVSWLLMVWIISYHVHIPLCRLVE